MQCTMLPHMTDTELLTTAEACALLGGIDRSTISRWSALGKITPARKLPGVNGALLFTRAEVERVQHEIKASR